MTLLEGVTCNACGGELAVVNFVARRCGTERFIIAHCVTDDLHRFEVVLHVRRTGHGIGQTR